MNKDDASQTNSQLRRKKAFFLRHSCIEELEKHLLAFEAQLSSHDVNVRWIENEENLCSQIICSLPKRNFNKVCFDLQTVPDKLLKSSRIHAVSVEEIENNQEEFDSLIVKADFGISETGSLVFINKPSKNCFNRVNHLIIILNIDQILVKQSDLSFFLSLLNDGDGPSNAVQDIKIIDRAFEHVNATMIQSITEPAFSRENVKIYVFLYDNGITNILQHSFLRQSLYCIHCGECLRVCPVAPLTGNISPIDLIKKNCFDDYNSTSFIFSHTLLCGNCAKVCPVNIPLTDLLICEMQLTNLNHASGRSKQLYNIFSRREKMNKYGKCLFHFYFTHHFYRKNKCLQNYFSKSRQVFFNQKFYSLDHNYNNDLEPEDITK